MSIVDLFKKIPASAVETIALFFGLIIDMIKADGNTEEENEALYRAQEAIKAIQDRRAFGKVPTEPAPPEG